MEAATILENRIAGKFLGLRGKKQNQAIVGLMQHGMASLILPSLPLGGLDAIGHG